jgi:hypothetical protein
MTYILRQRYHSLLGLIWLVSASLLLFAGRSAIADWQMGDPDDQLRLVQIRDWLAGQSWFDVTQYRMNPPNGGPMHWSRLVDVPVAAVILLLRLPIGQGLAEHIAVVVVPLLTYGAVMWLMARIATQVADRRAGLVAGGALFAVLPATMQLAPMRIDHHGWQLVMFLAATSALLDKQKAQRAAIIIGLASAIWLEISIEGLPFAVLFMGLLALRWLGGNNDRASQFPLAMAVLAASAAVLYALTAGLGKKPNHCDALSPVHLGAIGAAALIIITMHPLAKRFAGGVALATRLGGAAIAGAAAIGMVLWAAPQCAVDAFAGLDPLVRQYWYNRTPEGLPLWQHKPGAIVQELSGLLVGLIALTAFYRRNDSPVSADRVVLALLFAGSLAIAIQVARAAVYPLCLSVVLAAPLVVRLFESAAAKTGLAARMGLRIAAIALLMPGVVGAHLSKAVIPAVGVSAGKTGATANAAFIALARKCQSAEAIRALNHIPSAQLMTGLDVSPGILQFTHHKVVATGHHRNQDAMRDVIRAYTLQPAAMREVLKARRVDYLVSCDGSFELQIYRDTAPDGFWARLKQGETFSWLVRQTDVGPYQIWQVKRSAL